jgi:hypothetical protein
MLDTQTILSMSREAARNAAREHLTPFMLWAEDLATMPPFPFPFIGDYHAPGWRKTGRTFFVDSSGSGEPGEAALTAQEFISELKVGFGYAVIETGEFQVYVAEYRKTHHQPTPELTEPVRSTMLRGG